MSELIAFVAVNNTCWKHYTCEKNTDRYLLTIFFSSLQIRKTRHAMYVWRNVKGRSCNHCCSGKAM